MFLLVQRMVDSNGRDLETIGSRGCGDDYIVAIVIGVRRWRLMMAQEKTEPHHYHNLSCG
jgi:hypothetical protein